jgi:hypothetical protein
MAVVSIMETAVWSVPKIQSCPLLLPAWSQAPPHVPVDVHRPISNRNMIALAHSPAIKALATESLHFFAGTTDFIWSCVLPPGFESQ